MCSSPRASMGLSMLPASTDPSAAPAPTTVCNSSTNSRIRPCAARTSLSTALSRSSNSPRYFAPATSAPMSSEKTVLSRSPSGTSPAGDPLGEAFDDGCLADAGVTDEHRVVLRLAGQDLYDSADLAVAADDRVEPALGSVGDEVTAVLLQRLVGGFRHGGGDPLVSPDAVERAPGKPRGSSPGRGAPVRPASRRPRR